MLQVKPGGTWMKSMSKGGQNFEAGRFEGGGKNQVKTANRPGGGAGGRGGLKEKKGEVMGVFRVGTN